LRANGRSSGERDAAAGDDIPMSDTLAALDALYPLPPEELSRQWILTREAGSVPPGWPCHGHGGWTLAIHPDTELFELRDRAGAAIGWAIDALGHRTAESAQVMGRTLTLPLDPGFSAADAERALYGRDAAGRSDGTGFIGSTWTAILFGGAMPRGRVYVGAAHAVVYAPERAAVASTHNPIPGLERDRELSAVIDPLRTDAYFALGLTAFRGLAKLLPNHVLDLETFRARRHWPVGPLAPRTGAAEAGRAMVARTRADLEALARRFRVFRVPLTAGRDSRAVLACLRPLVEEGCDVCLFITERRSLSVRIDVDGARRLSRIADLPLEVTRVGEQAPVSAEAVRRNFARIGEARAGQILASAARDRTQPDPARLTLPGMAGSVGRAFYWPSGTPDSGLLEPERFGMKMCFLKSAPAPVRARLAEAAERVLGSLPAEVRADPANVLDLADVEQRLGCWEAPNRYLFPGRGRANFSPMASAFALDTMLHLHEADRAAGTIQAEMIAAGWPELLAIPFNRGVGLLRVPDTARRWRKGAIRRGRRLAARFA
jgi:hypothetical protein